MGSGPPFLSTKNPLQLHVNGVQKHCQETTHGQNYRLLRTNTLVEGRRFKTLI